MWLGCVLFPSCVVVSAVLGQLQPRGAAWKVPLACIVKDMVYTAVDYKDKWGCFFTRVSSQPLQAGDGSDGPFKTSYMFSDPRRHCFPLRWRIRDDCYWAVNTRIELVRGEIDRIPLGELALFTRDNDSRDEMAFEQ
jgi:hypothetical protein